jgi:hypothetical protein
MSAEQVAVTLAEGVAVFLVSEEIQPRPQLL